MKAVVTKCPGCGTETKFEHGDYRIVRGPTGQRAKGSGIKRTPQDDKASKRVRQRDGHCCTVCGKSPNVGGLHAMHCYSRSKDSLFPGFDKHSGDNCCLRHYDDNLAAGCWGCHTKLDENIPLKYEHFKSLIGEERFERLTELSQTTYKRVRRSA